MRRPLFMVCLCLVAIAVLRLWLYDTPNIGGGQELPLSPEEGEIITVTGRVHQKDTQSFIIDSVELLPETLTEEKKILQSEISSYAAASRQSIPFKDNLICEYTEDIESDLIKENLCIGSTVTLQGTFKGFLEATNPGEFNVAEYYNTLGIGGKLTDITVFAVGSEYSEWREVLYLLRCYFKKRLYAVFPKKEASVLTAMLLGDKEDLDSEIEELYKQNGIIHILSISGLHITMIGISIYQLLRRVGVPVWLAAVCGGGILCLYGVMTGLSVSACRAIGMYLIRMLAEIVGRTYDMLTALGVLAAVMVWQNPANLNSAGFLLSFGSVLGIGWLYPALLTEKKKNVTQRYETVKWKRVLERLWQDNGYRLVQSILASGSITLFTLPIQLWFYYEVPIYSVFLNLLVLPFMSLVMTTGLVVMLLPGTGVFGTITALILQGYERLCECFGQLPFHTWNPGKPEIWQVAVYYMVLFVLVILRGQENVIRKGICKCFGQDKGQCLWDMKQKYQHLWMPAMLTMAVIILTLRIRTGTTVTFLDVGQGDCIVIETAFREVYVFDCGSSSRNQVGEYVLIPFLKYRGIRHIDAIFASHPDTDHCSGIKELLTIGKEEGVTAGQLVLPEIAETMREGELSSLSQFDIPISYISAGDSFTAEGASFLCLHPPKEYLNEDSNAYSQCFYVELYGNSEVSLLLTGDVEGEGEELLVQELKNRDIADVTVLKVPHHGSRNSAKEELLAQLSPDYAVISCGRNNSYGHPHEELLQRLKSVSAHILRTDVNGAITLHCGKKQAQIRLTLPHSSYRSSDRF